MGAAGGGGAHYNSNSAGGKGGSGVVVIASAGQPLVSISSGLTYTLDTSSRPGFWLYRFTAGAGSIVGGIYCIMNSAVSGGGWMMAMKATRGNTFSYCNKQS